MDRLARVSEETTAARELKRALSVRIGLAGMAMTEVGELL